MRPVLEYGSSVWDPQTHGLQEELEKVRNHAAMFVTRNFVFETEHDWHFRSTEMGIS